VASIGTLLKMTPRGLLFDPTTSINLRGRHEGIHNFSVGTLESYFYLLNEKSVVTYHNDILHIRSPQGRAKTWIFTRVITPEIQTQAQDFRKFGPVYSKVTLNNCPGESKFNEVTYDLFRVFDPASYPSKKKRYQRITYPERRLAAQGITIRSLTSLDLPVLRELHDRWVSHKMSQPATFQMMFPRKRYFECCRIATHNPHYIGYVAKQGCQLIGARVLYRDHEYAFDLAQFCSPDAESNTAEYVAVTTMRMLRDAGVRILNSGASLNKNLSAYKHHWPHSVVGHFAYSQLKKTS